MTSEAAVQAAVRAEYARRGYRLWRNNVGQLRDDRGVPVRFGLANDSAVLNARLKSSDLIGWFPHVVTQADVGTTIARMVSLECKPPDWRLRPGDARAQAQARWLDLVTADGGEARFITGVDT